MEEAPKVALITGAAKRVGRAVAETLATAGYDIAFTYLKSENDAQDLADAVRSAGRCAVPIRADLTDLPAGINAIEREFRQVYPRLDLLVNNASLYGRADLAATRLDLTRRLWAIHVEAPLLLCQRFAADLRQSNGHVINMVDLMAERPSPHYLAYCTTKAALVNLTLGLARELAPEVTVNGIAPGVVEWPDGYPQEDQEKYLKRVPLARPGTPQDVAAAVLFFATHAPYVTGQILRLDGGRSTT